MKFEVVTFRSSQRYHDINYYCIKDLHIENWISFCELFKINTYFSRKPNNCYRSLWRSNKRLIFTSIHRQFQAIQNNSDVTVIVDFSRKACFSKMFFLNQLNTNNIIRIYFVRKIQLFHFSQTKNEYNIQYCII